MKKVLLALLLLVGYAVAQNSLWEKLYVLSGVSKGNQIILIEDKETGTRCYAITNSELNSAGYGIYCIPKQEKISK